MKGREGNYRGGSAHSSDLLACFPSRAHLALTTPKRICSPARPSDSHNRCHNNRRRHVSKLAGSQASPLHWGKPTNKQIGSAEMVEPTSPKVTCAGQIKVRPTKPGPDTCKNWQSVMEEIERIHNSRSQSKFFGFKKDVMNFLACLRNIRFDFRCLGSLPEAEITSDDEEEDEDNEYEHGEEEEESSRTAFSKWSFMVLQENHQNDNDVDNNGLSSKREKKQSSCDFDDVVKGGSDAESAVPPPNALLLMRCRSAPAKSWLEEKKAEKELEHKKEKELENNMGESNGEELEKENVQKKRKKKDLRSLMEEETMNLVVMRYDTDFYKLSTDIAEETWVVGGIKDPLSRSRSWKR